jgi:hypothetical protein
MKERRIIETMKQKKKSCLLAATYCKKVKDKVLLKAKKDKKKEKIHTCQDYIQSIHKEIQLVGMYVSIY